MLRKKFIPVFLMFALLFPLILAFNVNVKANTGTIPQYMAGDYTGNASMLYYDESFLPVSWVDNRSSDLYAPNITNSQNYVLTGNNLEIRADRITEEPFTSMQVIAENETARVNISNAVRVAQEFNVSRLVTIESIRLYLEHSLLSNY